VYSRSDWKKGICSSVNKDQVKCAKRHSTLMLWISWGERLWYRPTNLGEPDGSSTCVTSSADLDA